MKTPTTLIILDGYGLCDVREGNAPMNAHTPNLDRLWQTAAHCTLSASGRDVGLPEGQAGNCKAGHMNLGAGRVVWQDAGRVHMAIEDGSFDENPVYCSLMDHCASNHSALHLVGLLTDGPYSSIRHLQALLDLAKGRGVQQIWIHAFLGGEDGPGQSDKGLIEQTVSLWDDQDPSPLATVSGCNLLTEEEGAFDGIKQVYAALTQGAGALAPDPVTGISQHKLAGGTDGDLPPMVVTPGAVIGPEDSVIFFHLPEVGARNLTRALTDPGFAVVPRGPDWAPSGVAWAMEWGGEMPDVPVAFPKQVDDCFGDYLSQLGLTQLRIAQEETYDNVTAYFNGDRDLVFPKEARVRLPSSPGDGYALHPEMEASQVAAQGKKAMESGQYDVIVISLANCEMVGRTGDYDAAVQAAEAADGALGTLLETVSSLGGIALITADHGNCEEMIHPDGRPHTGQTTNPVPFFTMGANVRLRSGGRLADVAPTMLDLMGLGKPAEMTGRTLIVP